MTSLFLPSKTYLQQTNAPRFITEWPDAPSVGSKIAKVQRSLGSEPLPWQVLAAHAVGARNLDGTPRFPFVLVSVPRQAGKTRASWSWLYHKALTVQKSKNWYTADTGTKARARWLEMVEDSNVSPWAPLTQVKKTNGSEALQFPKLRSQIRPHPPTEDSLHSEQSDMNVIDEGWSYDEAQASALMQAIVPTQATRPHRQTIITSTMGTGESTWFHNLIDRAYAGDPGIFLLDYGIPDSVDPTNLEEVAAYHPAYGLLPGVDLGFFEQSLAQLGTAGFARAMGNRRTATRDSLIPLQVYRAAQTEHVIPPDVFVSFGSAIDLDRTETAIAAAAWVDGVPIIEIIDVRPGTTWGVDRLAHLIEKSPAGQTTLVIDRISPSSTLFAEATRANLKPLEITARDLATATVEVWDRMNYRDQNSVLQPRIRFRPDPALDLAVEVADRRNLGDSWTWDRKGSAGSIAALEAATLALHGLLNRPVPAQKPMIY